MAVAPEAVVVSFRLGGADGVAVEARKWDWALGELGFEVRRVAGAIEDDGRPDDTCCPVSRSTRPAGGRPRTSHDSTARRERHRGRARRRRPRDRRQPLLAAAQPRRRAPRSRASRPATAAACCSATTTCPGSGGTSRTWAPTSRRASPARCTRRSTCAAGASSRHAATRARRPFTTSSTSIRRPATAPRRAQQFGFRDDELVVLQPSRAIERKNVPGAVRVASHLARA